MKSTPKSTAEFDYQQSLKKSNRSFLDKSLKINKCLNRPVASLLVRVLIRTKITPNQVTIMSFLIGVIAAFFFSFGKHVYFILGGIFTQLASIVDCADGMLARAKNATSRYGAFLDIFLDRLFEFLLLAGIMIGLFRSTQNLTLLVLALCAVALYFLEVSLYYVTMHYTGKEQNEGMSELRALFLFIILVLALVNRLDIGVYIFLGVVVFNNVYLLINFLSLDQE